MPFGLKLRRTRRYNVLSKNYFVTRIRLLDSSTIECTLSVESTGQECLEAVAQRLELRETHFFGLWFYGKAAQHHHHHHHHHHLTPGHQGAPHHPQQQQSHQQQQQQQQRWVELEKPLKKQMDKFGSEPLLMFGVMFYVPNVARLEQEATRYQYYLQVKREVLDGRLHCTVDQGIRLAGLAVQADFGDYNQYPSQDFLREYVLFPVIWPVDGVCEEWTQKVAEEHKRHWRMQTAEAELLYIKEVEKLDGFGQESFMAKDNYTNDIIIGVSFIGLFVKHRNGRSIMLHRWKDIGTIGHNKAAITVEITSRDDTIMFHTEDMEIAKYIARLFTARHKFYKQNKICAEPAHSPAPIRRRPTWNRLPRPQSCILQPMRSQSSQDSIFLEESCYFKSESSLDRCVELGGGLGYHSNGGGGGGGGGLARLNGSMCSTPSVSSLSLSRSQTLLNTHAHTPTLSFGPPLSNSASASSLSMAPDYTHTHSHTHTHAHAHTPPQRLPSYRPTPDYEAVMRLRLHHASSNQHAAQQPASSNPQRRSTDGHSQSLRSLNISTAHAYRTGPEALGNSQPEIRGAWQPSYGGQVPTRAVGRQAGAMGQSCGPLWERGVSGGGVASPIGYSTISHTVSTPELANNVALCGGGGGLSGFEHADWVSGVGGMNSMANQHTGAYEGAGGGARNSNSAACSHVPRSHLSRHTTPPPPPYPSSFRPASSTPELANSLAFRPAVSTPELSLVSVPRGGVAMGGASSPGGSSPELLRGHKLPLAVKTFQPDTHSCGAVRHSLQEPLGAAQRSTQDTSSPPGGAPGQRSTTTNNSSSSSRSSSRHNLSNLTKRHSMEVLLARGVSVSGGGASGGSQLLRRNTLREQSTTAAAQAPPTKPQAPPTQPQQAPKEASVPMPAQKAEAYAHQKTLSNATMLVHSSESESEEEEGLEEEGEELDVRIPGLHDDIDAQLQAALAKLPSKPPPQYPGLNTHTHGHMHTHTAPAPPQPNTHTAATAHTQRQHTHAHDTNTHTPGHSNPHIHTHAQAGGVTGGAGGCGLGAGPAGASGLGPSISEPDLSSVKERVRKEPVKERPVSEMFAIEDVIVEREIAQRTLERQQQKCVESQSSSRNGPYHPHTHSHTHTRTHTHTHAAAKANTDERCKVLEMRLLEGQLWEEFEAVPNKQAEPLVTTATLPDNAERNRSRDVLPYEENRVELIPHKDNNTGYINASHIKVSVCGEEWHYIATQGPLANTAQDFWQMVWEQGVNVIAMVTAEEEGGKTKSHRYWPKLGSKHNSATHGKFKVTSKFRTDSGCYATSGLKVRHLASGQERTVWHLQYTDWPQGGQAQEHHIQGFLSYLEEIQSVRRHTNSMLEASSPLSSQPSRPPLVVHCSAGIGRTGVVMLSELMISCLEHNERVEVPVMLHTLRYQRMLLVQTASQYQFVYQVLIQFLKNSRLI
ncbi:tyrosine-protein phosphatase non-receptor type 14-like [Engraulis encrasicolus]|uniref:tyrosine-protein phosphatase non-receptor type 14-like n=1 Tax=Engraulis encrasicolus TaxID=184585 RepID=UPI002FD20A25